MAQNVFFKKGLLANLPESYSAGTFYVTVDERAMYLDIDDSTRIRLGDFIQVDAVANLPTDGASTSALYYCVAENILAKWNGSAWTQINKQPTAEEMKTLLGLGALAYKSEVAEGDLSADLLEKVNASAEGNHSHSNKDVLDGITAEKVAAWDAAEQNAKDYADGLADNYAEAEHTHTKDEITDFAHTHVASEITDLDDTIKGYDYATKTELGDVDAKFTNYKTAADQKAIDDEQDRRLGVIEGDYLKAADIANFETKDNVKKVADDLAAYVEFNDAALAAETKARTDADAGFETRIAALEGNFGDGEGTVESQIAAAVAAEAEIARAAEKANADDIDTLEGRMDTAEGKISALETESAKHAIKTEVEGALVFKADKSVVDAMYTNGQIDTAVQGAKDYAKGLVDAIPAQTDYTVTITPTNGSSETDYAKRYTFTQNGAEIGTIDLAKELVVTSGSVKEVTEVDAPYTGAKVGDKYIELVIANQDAPIYVPAKDLVDIYTAKDGAAEVQIAISNTNEISATLVNKGITTEKIADGAVNSDKLADLSVGGNKLIPLGVEERHIGAGAITTDKIADANVTEAKLSADVTTKLNKAHEHTNKAELDKVADGDVAKWNAAQANAEATAASALASARTEITTEIGTAISGEVSRADGKYEEKGVAQGIVDGLKLGETYEPIGAEDRAVAAAKTETENQIDAFAETVYTKSEVEALIQAAHQWGEF